LSHFELELSGPYFAPGNEPQNAIIQFINDSINTIQVASYHLTDFKIVNALIAAKNKGIPVEIIIDQASEKWQAVKNLCNQNLPVWVFHHEEGKNLMHNKFLTCQHPEKEWVGLGSYNFTYNAATHHDNILFLDDVYVVKEYKDKFDVIKEISDRLDIEMND